MASTKFATADTESILSFNSTSSEHDHPRTCLKKKKKKNGLISSTSTSTSTSSAMMCYNRLCQWMREKLIIIDQEGAAFRAALTSQDIQVLKLARFFFHSCTIVAPLLYYMGTVERPCKFPASISFTIRKGPPKHAQMLLWGVGWALMGRIIRNRGSKMLQKFSAKMFLTGAWTTILFRLGRGKLSDACHFCGAGLYMLDHVVLLRILNTRPVFRTIFSASFALLLTSIGGTRAIEARTGIPTEGDSKITTADRARRVQRLPLSLQRTLFYWELLLMLSENMLFSSFVQGMPSGLCDRDVGDKDSKKENINDKDSKEEEDDSNKNATD